MQIDQLSAETKERFIMFRHILLYCMVVALFMMATGTALSANTVVGIDFEDPQGYELKPVSTPLDYPPLTIEFKSTNPAKPNPYLGKYGDPGAGGWLCNILGQNDVTIPPYTQGGQFFLSWVINDPINYDLEVRFSQSVDKFEGDIFDVDPVGEVFIITAYDASEINVISSMTVTPSSPPGGGDCGIQHWAVSGSGIRMVKFDGYKPTDNLGFGIDNLKVTYTPVLIPTFTQWGLIGLMLVILALATWVFFWRRRAVRRKLA
jgi:hypothetical protein